MAQRALIRAGLVLVLVGLMGGGCQQYEFEELPSSVIKESRWETTVVISAAADILFVIDNSGSMVGEQLQLGASFGAFTDELEKFFGDDYHIAVVTTGVESTGCPPCTDTNHFSCMNATGEGGRFQDWLGHNDGTVSSPSFSFFKPGDADYPNDCGKIIDGNNKHCFYDASTERGIGLVGINGCGYERGLEPIRLALGDLLSSQPGFLRDNATLAVILVSDEEDCGKVGDVNEDPAVGGMACYFAAKGVDGDGNTNDASGKPYQLTPVKEYYDFLLNLKGGTDKGQGRVKFAAIVGVKDPDDLSTTQIEYEFDDTYHRWDATPACETPGCKAQCDSNDPGYQRCLNYCEAKPGTRYIKLAQMFGLGKGQNGFVDTICQNDFSQTMKDVGNFIGCPHHFSLSEPILHPDLANILINDEEVPRYSCGFSDQVRLVECNGPDDDSCPDGVDCIPTWTYQPPSDPPDPQAKGGTISFAPHYDPCEFFKPGESVHIELVYVIP